METQISKPEDFHDQGFFHKHSILGAVFFLLIVVGVVFGLYSAFGSELKCKAFASKCEEKFIPDQPPCCIIPKPN